MKIPLIDINKQHEPIKDELDQSILNVMASVQYIMCNSSLYLLCLDR